ncbi:MAG TPA: dihydropteroate synthase [Acidobacteriota bacterium]|nr:dihydropteroate synthase [Acidobacteriota bacterium]
MERAQYVFCPRDKILQLGKITRIMGVVNITPDSFSDGGKFLDTSSAISHCYELLEAGADLLDLGGESSRPGARPVSPSEELDRVAPVLERLRPNTTAIISIDTYKPEVARECLRLGADVINDITALRFAPEMAVLVKEYGAGLILMHMRGMPDIMQELPPSRDILADIRADLSWAVAYADNAGLGPDRVIVDPGIGFGKTFEDNLLILNRLSFLSDFRRPVLVGPSRKSFLGKITGQGVDRRAGATVAACVAAALRGAHMVRVHNVVEVREALQVADAILNEGVAEC